jgi:hypothetical protein
LPLAARAKLSEAHLAQQANDLASALQDLGEAQQRLRSQPDPHNAGEKIDAGCIHVRQAWVQNQTIAQDLYQLNETAASLQHQIVEHRNDLLGPRGRRIRNEIIILAVLVGIGAALLRIGPLFGGPFGGAVIVVGHLLTACIVPLLSGLWWLLSQAWSAAVVAVKRIIAALEKLGGAKGASAANQQSGANPLHAATAPH